MLLKGEPLIIHALRPALGCAARVIIVGGYRFGELERLVSQSHNLTAPEKQGILLVENKAYPDGMFSSVKVGIRKVEEQVEGVFILPADMPCVDPATYRVLADAFDAQKDIDVVSPTSRRISLSHTTGSHPKKGHPILIRRRICPEILAADEHWVLRDVLRQFSTSVVEVDDAGILIDIDEAKDLGRFEDR